MRVGLLGAAFLSVAGLITAGNTDANIVFRDSNVPLRKSFDPKDRPPIIEGPAVQPAPKKEDPKTKSIETLKTQNMSLKENVIDKGKFDAETKTRLEMLHKSGTAFLDSVKNGGDRKKEIEALGKMDMVTEQLLERDFFGKRLVQGIGITVRDLQTIYQLEAPRK